MTAPRRIVSVGMFDGVHRGHAALIGQLTDEAARQGLRSGIVTFDRHPLEVIAPEAAPKLLMTPDDKIAALHGLGIEDVFVLQFDDSLRALTAEKFMIMLRDRYDASTLLMGFNHRFGSDRLTDINDYKKIGDRLGIEVIGGDELRDADRQMVPVSSSSIRKAVAVGDMKEARRMLGRPYQISGTVVAGRQIGRQIGFPTANLKVGDRLLLPGKGVYAVDVIMPDGDTKRGMMNIGRRPTVDKSADPATTIEIHIIGWDGELYGKEIAVQPLKRLRDEMRFNSVKSLRKQLEADRNLSLNIG